MIFGFGRKPEPEEDEEEVELVLFQGAVNGQNPNLSANARLAEAGLVPAKELVSDALMRRAEMIILEPKGPASTIRFFVDGIAYPGGRISKQEGLAVTQVLKLLAGLNIRERTTAQEGGIKASFQDTPYVITVKTTPLKGGAERLTLLSQNQKVKLEGPDDLGFTEKMRTTIRELTSRKEGLVLVCGMPLTGVTTTMIGVVKTVDSYVYDIVSICDLGGRELLGISSFDEINHDDPLDTTIQRIIRKDAQILFSNPIRDAETAKTLFKRQMELCILAEFTARDTFHGVQQLIKWVEDPVIVAEGLKAIVSPKLIRTLCTNCRQAFRPNPAMLVKVGLPKDTKVLYRPFVPTEEDEADPEFEECDKCGGLGFRGRVGMYEFLEVTEGMKQIIAAGGDLAQMKAKFRQEKQQSFQQEGLRLVAAGRTSLDELQRVFRPAK